MSTRSVSELAQRCLARIDADSPAVAGADVSSVPAAAGATRRAVVTVAIPDSPPITHRIGRPDETPERLIDRCLSGTWRSVSVEHELAGGVDYNVSPDPSLNSPGCDYGEWTWQLNRHSEWQAAAVHLHQTRDRRAAEAVAGWLRTWIETCPPPAPEFDTELTSWRTIEIGIRLGQTWPIVLSVLKDDPAVDDELWLAWLNVIAEQCEFVWERRKANNWLLMEMNGLLHAGVMLPFLRRAETWRQRALDTLIAETDTQFHADGFQRELSAGYHRVCLRQYLLAGALLERTGDGIPPAFADVVRTMMRPLRAMARPNGEIFAFQDGGHGRVSDTLRPLPESLRVPDDRFFLGEGPAPARRCDVLPNAGYACLRSGWEAHDTAVAFDAGPYGEAHQHEDKLSVQVWAHGEDLIGEAGTTAYADSPLRRYSRSTLAHSTAIVDGYGQSRRRTFAPGKLPMDADAGIERDLDAEQPWVRGRYDEGYGPDGAVDIVHTRTVTLRSPDVVEVRDRFDSRDGLAHRAEILFHVLRDHYSAADGEFVSREDGANVRLSAVRTDGGEVDFACVRGGEEPDLRGWAKPDVPPATGPNLPVPRPCVTFSVEFADTAEVVTTIEILPARDH